jgi:hypothetical protein
MYLVSLFGGEKYQNKKKSHVASGMAFGHVCVGVGVVEEANGWRLVVNKLKRRSPLPLRLLTFRCR